MLCLNRLLNGLHPFKIFYPISNPAHTQMETDTAQACGEITKAADGMRNLITEYEEKLLNKVKEAKETFKKQTAKRQKRMRRFKERYLQPEPVL